MTKAEIIDYLYDNNVQGDCSIEQMAEDLDRPQGEWVHSHEGTIAEGLYCSNCGKHGYGEKYCPHCGARMKGADDE